MPQHWILKTEPSDYSFADLERDRRTRWSGVSNPVALKHLRSMAQGDPVMIYHTGDEKRIVGLARVAGAPYPDPDKGNERLAVVDVSADAALPAPVTLAAIKAEPRLKEMALAKYPRLSVQPVTAQEWKIVSTMGGLKD